MKKFLLLILIFCALFRTYTFSQEMYFSSLTSFNGIGAGHSIVPTSDGGYIGVGQLFQSLNNSFILIFKINETGDLEWYNTVEGQSINIGYKIIATNDNNYLITAEIAEAPTGFPSQPYYGAYFSKINSQGDVIWENTFSEEGATYLWDACQASNNDYYFAGNNFGDGVINTSDGAWIVKSNNDGDTLWTKTLDSNIIAGLSVVPSFDSGCVLNGIDHFVTEDTTSGSNLSYQNPSPSFIKLDQQGNQIWQKYIDTTLNARFEEGITVDGYNSIFAGSRANFNNTIQKAFLASIDEFGDTLWTKTIDGITNFYSISIYESENAFVCGGYINNNNGSFPATAKFDFDGNLLWEKVYTDIPSSSIIWGVHSTPDGGAIATGKYSGNNNGVLIIKTNNQGEYSSVGLDIAQDSPNNKIAIYPNPVVSKLTIDLSRVDYKNLDTEIYSSDGRLVKKISFSGEESVQFDVSEIPSGFYHIRMVIDRQKVVNEKFIKQ